MLGPLVRSFNHVLLTGQRRMGKTSIARELGRRLCGENWQFIFIDVGEAATVEDVIALLASGMRKVVPLGARWKKLFGHAWTMYIEEGASIDKPSILYCTPNVELRRLTQKGEAAQNEST